MFSHEQAQETKKWLKDYEGWAPLKGGNQMMRHVLRLEENTK